MNALVLLTTWSLYVKYLQSFTNDILVLIISPNPFNWMHHVSMFTDDFACVVLTYQKILLFVFGTSELIVEESNAGWIAIMQVTFWIMEAVWMAET
jgi:hypothetical protein